MVAATFASICRQLGNRVGEADALDSLGRVYRRQGQFSGRGLLARFLYSLPQSLVGRRQPGAPPVPQATADRYTLELQALAASLAVPAGDDGPALLTLDQVAGELLLGFERDLEPRLAADRGDLAHLTGWAAKLAGATCRLAALLHLADHLCDGWAARSTPTPSPAQSGWPTTSLSTPEPCST